MIAVTCQQFADFLDKVSKSTRKYKGMVKLSLTNYDKYYKVSMLTINSVSIEVYSDSNSFEFEVPIQYIRNFRDYLRTIPNQPFKIFFEDNSITPIIEHATPRYEFSGLKGK